MFWNFFFAVFFYFFHRHHLNISRRVYHLIAEYMLLSRFFNTSTCWHTCWPAVFGIIIIKTARSLNGTNSRLYRQFAWHSLACLAWYMYCLRIIKKKKQTIIVCWKIEKWSQRLLKMFSFFFFLANNSFLSLSFLLLQLTSHSKNESFTGRLMS